MDHFTNLYPVSKTLRFELIPDKRTKAILERTDLIAQDEHRAESYKLVKKIIDRYHKKFIDSVLGTLKLPLDDLDSLHELYSKSQKSDADKKALEKIQDKLRKLIADALTKDSRYKRIDKKELIREDILSVIEPEEQALIDEFRDFTTYFTGFHENRRNMYSAEAQSTAIAYRLIHENLPKFIDNMATFEKIAASPVAKHFPQLYQEMAEYLNVREIGDLFKLDYYTELLTQSQIEAYNAVIGGRTVEESGKKIQGINEYVNLYNQQQPSRDTRLPKLKPLFKQILSDREAVSWLPEEFESDKDMLKAVKECYHSLNDHVFDPLRELLTNLSSYNLDGIFIPNDLSLTDISQAMFKDWSVIKKAIAEDVKRNCPLKRNEKADNYEERISKLIKRENSFSIGYMNHCIQEKDICDHFATLGASDNGEEQTVNLFLQIHNAYTDAQSLIENDYPEDRNLAQDKENVARLKALLDAVKALQRFVKPLLGNGDEPDKDERFYGELAVLWEELDHITPLYNKVRNRMTRKPYSIEKFKLNFQNSTLLDGWDLNKERDNTGVIMRKDGKYFLAIMNKQFNRIFVDAPQAGHGEDTFEKMEYKLLPGANKMLPKVFFSKSRIEEFKPSPELLEHYEKGTHKKGDNFSLKDCHELIDFFKASIAKHEDWSKFDFHFSPTDTYEDLSGFYREVEQMGYKISYKQIPVSYIDKMVEEGKLFLFQIYNKDFSPYSKGTPNLHTLYWKMVFDERNLADVVYKLNGQAEVFYRKKSLDYDRPTHPANQAIKNKNPETTKKESTFDYDIIKDKRFTMDKFQFHVPITINFKATGSGSINPLVNQYIHDHDDLHFIGIDRGERHLLYVTVIDSKGCIKEQFSLNEIVNEYQGNTYKTNYRSLLDKRDDERQRERQSWNTIEGIKELKQGYLSQVIHKIVSLMVKYHAVVVLEDLNMGFKRGRQKVESSVYQQFEKALIDKLNLLIDKKIDADRPGGLLHAYQLTNKFTSFRDMGRQNGFLFYIPAWNTSKIDPVTGFVDLLHPRYESVEKSRSFFCKFKSIRYNQDKGWYEFTMDYNDFTTKAEGTRTEWTLCTHGTRVETFRNAEKNSSWDSREVNLTDEFNALFATYGIEPQGNLKQAIAEQSQKDFFDKLTHLLALTLQMRNSITGTEVDYMISPVADENGKFFDSRTCGKELPENADANGAYNIARKGLWVARQIQAAQVDEKVNMAISNKEWLSFAQSKPYLND
jgi:CRISPR-associated protein Cpf1